MQKDPLLQQRVFCNILFTKMYFGIDCNHMKKNIFFSIVLIGVLVALPASAETTTTGQQGTSTTPSLTLDYRYNAVLEFFLQKTKENAYETAYELMGGNFPVIYTQDDFANIVDQAGLTTFSEKKWTSFQNQMKDIGVTTITGEFKMPDGEVHKVTFYIIVQGETELKIGNITEDVSVASLPKRFPNKEKLGALVKQDLQSTINFIRKNKVKKMHEHLSSAGQKRIKFREIAKAFRTFRKNKTDLTLPADAVIIIDKEYPKLNGQGLMVVAGEYHNAKNLVKFTLAYDYQWIWKLGGFSFTASPVAQNKL